MLALHWKGPDRLVKAAQITKCAMAAFLTFKLCPEKAIWALLVAFSIHDYFDVLHPTSLKRAFYEMEQERNELAKPSFRYTASVNQQFTTEQKQKALFRNRQEFRNAVAVLNERPEWRAAQPTGGFQHPFASACLLFDDDEHNGVLLGLGDFIFYSVMVAKARLSGDWNATIACYLGVLIGMFVNGMWSLLKKSRAPSPAAVPHLHRTLV
ncbi:Presenilin-like protein [Aphelenchoides fujianensis]|nr:Presenilin-like protein [Aphelenchoides fujianensis]